MIDLLTSLGQMNHISGNVICNKNHTNNEDKKVISVPFYQNGLMSMPVAVRQDLIQRGWNIVNEINDEIPFPLVVRKLSQDDIIVEKSSSLWDRIQKITKSFKL
jgi:hypothetical protein